MMLDIAALDALDLRVIALESHDKSRRPKSLETFVQENIAAFTAA